MRTKPKTNTKWRTTKFFKAWHENQCPRERNEGQEKKPHRCGTVTCLVEHATPTAVSHSCTLDETTIIFFCHRNCPHKPPK